MTYIPCSVRSAEKSLQNSENNSCNSLRFYTAGTGLRILAYQTYLSAGIHLLPVQHAAS